MFVVFIADMFLLNAVISLLLVVTIADIVLECNGSYLTSNSNNNLSRIKRNSEYRSDEACPIPEIENGKFEVIDKTYVSGQLIPNNTIVKFFCTSDNYVLNTSDEEVLCLNGKYQNELPKCMVTCPGKFPFSIEVDCELNGNRQNCSKQIPEGTIAHMKCKPHYVEINNGSSISACSGGSWNVSFKQCTPICGEPVNQPLYYNGRLTQRGDFPWHVAIYQQKPGGPLDYVCGGSIISERVVISAATCFTNLYNGILYPASEFSLAAGIQFSDWFAPEDTDYVQNRKITEIHVPSYVYKGVESNFTGNIAVVLIHTPFDLSDFVLPVCVDWSKKYIEDQLKPGIFGHLPSWGTIKNGYSSASIFLKEFTFPFVERTECLKSVPEDFVQYVTSDKFCAGYTNGTSICFGDTGGGIVFPFEDSIRKKYYIQGVVSLGPVKDDNCDDEHLGVYTQVTNYIDFIKKIEIANKLEYFETGSCPIPEIENGKFQVSQNEDYISGQPILDNTTVNFSCNNDSYELIPPYKEVLCRDGNYQTELPKCILTCNANFSTSIIVECKFNGFKHKCTKKVPEGTIAYMKCKTHYVDMGGSSKALCSGGIWDAPFKQCSTDCGELVPDGQTLIVNGTEAIKSEFPWHVAVYRATPEKLRDYICGGSIISEKVVISAAHCFANLKNGQLYPVSEFSVAAGKDYSNWDAAEDTDFVQKRNITKIEIPKNTYFGLLSNHAGDIAVVVLDKPFIVTSYILPVCVDWELDYVDQQLKSNVLGQVAGWGSTTTGNPKASTDLKQLSAPFVERLNCTKIVPQNFIKFVTADKFCAGYTNGTSVCAGDSGGGIVFPNEESGLKKYYIQGIVSVGPVKEGACDNEQLGVYTKVANYISFIKFFLELNKIL